MDKVLAIEDMRALAGMVAAMIKDKWGLDAVIAVTQEKAIELMNDNTNHYFAAVVDLHLPDAPEGEAVDAVIQHKIRCLHLPDNLVKRYEKIF